MATICIFLHVHRFLFCTLLAIKCFCQLKLDSHFNQSKTDTNKYENFKTDTNKYENFNLKNTFDRKSMNKTKNENRLSCTRVL